MEKQSINSDLVFLVGPSGSGKTVVGESLARRLGWQVFDTDAMIVARSGKTISEVFAQNGEPHFRALEKRMVGEVLKLAGQEPAVVATGGGLPTIKGMMANLLRSGTVVYLAASLDELWNRLTVDPADLQARPLLRDGGRVALERMMSEREPIYMMASIIQRTDGLEVDQVVDRLMRSLTAP